MGTKDSKPEYKNKSQNKNCNLGKTSHAIYIHKRRGDNRKSRQATILRNQPGITVGPTYRIEKRGKTA